MKGKRGGGVMVHFQSKRTHLETVQKGDRTLVCRMKIGRSTQIARLFSSFMNLPRIQGQAGIADRGGQVCLCLGYFQERVEIAIAGAE
jgi:hypothetical protein